MKYSIENKITEYYVRDNIYLHVVETEFSPLGSSNNYDSDWDMYPENEVQYTFILDESAEFMNSEDRNAQRQEVRKLNNTNQLELIELALEGVGVEV